MVLWGGYVLNIIYFNIFHGIFCRCCKTSDELAQVPLFNLPTFLVCFIVIDLRAVFTIPGMSSVKSVKSEDGLV